MGGLPVCRGCGNGHRCESPITFYHEPDPFQTSLTILQYASTIFAVMAPLPTSRTAAALALHTFSRTFAQVRARTVLSIVPVS